MKKEKIIEANISNKDSIKGNEVKSVSKSYDICIKTNLIMEQNRKNRIQEYKSILK